MKQKLLLVVIVVLHCFVALAQNRTITGKVSSKEDGQPLPGVSVKVTGTKIGTTTLANGSFTLSIPANARSLEVSYIGYATQTVEIGSGNVVNVSLAEDTKALGEVVVTGYSTTTKQSFTGSIKQVSGENLERKSVSNISQALSGEVPGLQVINSSGQPGTSATIRVRGFGSVNGSRDPLYVIDGVPYSGNLNSINMDDIESVSVLKDAAATAIYGARGANGVILINTKSGKGKPAFIEADANFGSNMALLPRYDVIKSPEQYVGLSWEAMYNQGVAAGSANPTNYANTRLFGAAGISPFYNIWNAANAAALIDPATKMIRPGVSRKYNPENWEDYAFQNAARNEYNVKFGGSNGKTHYYTSFGYLQDKGYSISSNFDRLTGRINLTQEIKPWLTGGFNLGYTNSKTNRGGQSSDSGSIFWFVDNIPSIYPLFLRDAAGNIVHDPIFGGNQYDYGAGGGNERGFGGLTNAIADATYNTRRDNRNELNGAAFLNFNIIDGLTFENRLGVQYFNNVYTTRANKFYGSSASIGGSLGRTTNEMLTNNLLNLLRYKRNFGSHNFEALLAHESTEWKRNTLSASKTGLVVNDLEDFNNAVVSLPTESYTDKYAIESYFGQVNYNYNDKYYVSASLRRDGSSRFVKNKWGSFGSFGAAWLITKEDFMKSQKIFSSLKLKASYGLTGDQAGVGYYPGFDLYNVDNLNGLPAFSFATKGNPDLTWETSQMYQAGLEFSLGNYLSGELTYYVKNTKDLIFDRRVGPSIGYALIKVNDGRLRNQGFEFDLTGHVLNKGDWKLDLTLNGEMFRNKIIAMPVDPATGQQKVIDIQGNYGWAVGHSIYDYYMRESAGVDPADGKAKWAIYYNDANNNNIVDAGESVASLAQYTGNINALKQTTTKTWAQATQLYVGKSAIPKVRGAFNIRLGYKAFDLGIQMLYSLGGYSYDGTYAGLMSNRQIGNNNWHNDILGRWQKAGDITDIPRLSSDASQDPNVNSPSTRFLTKATYFSLNNVRLGYSLPNKLIGKLGLGNANIWISGDNLWLHSQRKGFNPSTAQDGASSTYRYSALSTISAGLRVKF